MTGPVNPQLQDNAIDNFTQVLDCLQATQRCGPIVDAGGFGVFTIPLSVVAVLTQGFVLSGLGNLDRALKFLMFAAVAFAWFWLLFGYGLTDLYYVDPDIWGLAVTLYTAFLMLGLLGMAAYLFVVISSFTAPGAWLPVKRGDRTLLLIVVLAITVGWRYVYLNVPEIAEGPFDRGPYWLQQAMGVWTIGVPVNVSWWILTQLTTLPMLLGFALLCLVAISLPLESVSRGVSVASVSTGAAASATTAGVTLVITPVITMVVGLIAFATGALVLFALTLYALYMAMLVIIGGLFTMAVVDR